MSHFFSSEKWGECGEGNHNISSRAYGRIKWVNTHKYFLPLAHTENWKSVSSDDSDDDDSWVFTLPGFTVIVLFQTHKLQKTESIYIYIWKKVSVSHSVVADSFWVHGLYIFTHRSESLGSETLNNLPRSCSKCMMKLVFESPSIWFQSLNS